MSSKGSAVHRFCRLPTPSYEKIYADANSILDDIISQCHTFRKPNQNNDTKVCLYYSFVCCLLSFYCMYAPPPPHYTHKSTINPSQQWHCYCTGNKMVEVQCMQMTYQCLWPEGENQSCYRLFNPSNQWHFFMKTLWDLGQILWDLLFH